jgi:hypothetical protein
MLQYVIRDYKMLRVLPVVGQLNGLVILVIYVLGLVQRRVDDHY